MKALLSLILIISGISLVSAQTTRRVNNTDAAGTNVYTTLQAAHDAAVANDIIIVEPSNVAYGDLTLTKPLKIYGNGYFLTTNTELKADTRPSTVGYIYFNTGSGGSAMYGVSSNGNIVIHGVSNVVISRCYLPSYIYVYNYNKAATVYSNVTGINITSNYATACNFTASGGMTIKNVLISNNILNYMNANATDITNVAVTNNTFNGSLVSTALGNAVFDNNLCIAGGTPTLSNVSISYNVSSQVSFGGGVGNVNSYDIQSDLVTGGAGISVDEGYQITNGSSLKTIGSGGGEVGAFGGLTPYIISGIPPIPSITKMVNTATGTTTNPIQVTISVKSNN